MNPMSTQPGMPGQDQMMMLLQSLKSPMGAAQGSGQPPLSPEEQAILDMLTKSGQMPPSNQQVPGLMQLMQSMSGGGAGVAPQGMLPPAY